MSERDDAIREELGRVLASDAFVSSPMLAAFLRFVVEETLAGREDRLKAYTIAVGALDRPESFDPNDNPVVRVQARRLRQALRRHYETVGPPPRIRIELPLGNYVPLFVEIGPDETARPSALVALAPPAGPSPPADAPAALLPAVVPPEAGRRSRLVLPVALATLIGMAIGFGGWQMWHRHEPGELAGETMSRNEDAQAQPRLRPDRQGLDASRVLPLLRIDVAVRQTDEIVDTDIYRNRLESIARRFDDTIVLTRRSPDYPAPDGQPLYLLSLLLAHEGRAFNVYYRLVHGGDDRILESGAYHLPSTDDGTRFDPAPGLEDLDLIRRIVRFQGTIARDLPNLPDLTPALSCLDGGWNFFVDSSPEMRSAAHGCLEAVVAANPRLTPALNLLGAINLAEFQQDEGRVSPDALPRAEGLLRRSIRVAPTSSGPFQILQDVLLIRGEVAAALEAGAHAVQLNPEDENAIGRYGATLARIGRYEEALVLLSRAEASAARAPRWMQVYSFLALNNLGRTDEADRRMAPVEESRSSLFLAALAIVAHRRGDAAAATRALASIRAIEPTLPTTPRAFLRRRGLSEAVIDRLMIDLLAAGFSERPI